MTTKEFLMRVLISRIYSGEYPPESRLPDRMVLRKELSCNMDSLQAAITRLVKLGHVGARGKHGTFVAASPPCLNKVAILFRNTPEEHASEFTNRLARNMVADHDPRYARFSNDLVFNLRQQTTSTPSDTDSFSLLRIGHYAGHVMPVEAFGAWAESIRALQPDRPWIGFSHLFEPGGPLSLPMHMLAFRWDLFLERAIAYLHERGRRQPVLIHYGNPGTRMATAWKLALQKAGLPVTDFCVIPSLPKAGYVLEFCFKLLSRQLEPKLDSCVISDESIVGQSLQAIQQTGMAIPRDMEVVAQATFPRAAVPESSMPAPMHHIGYSVSEAMEHAYHIIAAAQTKNPIPPGMTELALCESA
jgi:DNA-binding transcriptional regulator YhcF (GntR family)